MRGFRERGERDAAADEWDGRACLACSSACAPDCRRRTGTSKISNTGGKVKGTSATAARAADEECTPRKDWAAARTVCWDIFEVDMDG